jgi:hypothetical protein
MGIPFVREENDAHPALFLSQTEKALLRRIMLLTDKHSFFCQLLTYLFLFAF